MIEKFDHEVIVELAFWEGDVFHVVPRYGKAKDKRFTYSEIGITIHSKNPELDKKRLKIYLRQGMIHSRKELDIITSVVIKNLKELSKNGSF